MEWTEGHQRLFDRLEAVDPITPAGRRRQGLRQQAEAAAWAREQQQEQEYDRRGLFGWDRLFAEIREGR